MNILYKAEFVLLFSALVAGNCPVQEKVTPCECNSIEEGILLKCEGPEDIGNIPSVIENSKGFSNLELELKSLAVKLLPSAFEQVSSLHLYDVRIEKARPNSSFVWPKLFEVIIDSSSIEDKPLPDLKDAHQLSHFEFRKIDMPTIGPMFKENIPDALTYLDIRKTKTTTVEPQALSHLNKLQYLIMVDLPLEEFPRNALPVAMPDLQTFILGNTKIEKLEADFFEGMPNLEILMMNGNKLTTLDSILFAPVENHLTHLLAERNPLVCDCNLLWFKNKAQNKGLMKIMATCKDLATLKTKEVTSLNENEYCS